MKKVIKWMIFEGLYLLHQPLDFTFIFWDRFQIECGFSDRNLDPIKGVLKVRCIVLSEIGVVLDYFPFVNFLTVFTIARLFFEPRNFFDDFFGCKDITRMDVHNFLVGNFLIAIGLLVVFSLQSENDGIL